MLGSLVLIQMQPRELGDRQLGKFYRPSTGEWACMSDTQTSTSLTNGGGLHAWLRTFGSQNEEEIQLFPLRV